MNLEQHQNRDDMKVWLSKGEIATLLDHAESTQERIGLGLGVRCGLRSHEILDVAPQHVHDTEAGQMLRVWHGKGDKYRETPIPEGLATQIETVGDIRGDASTSVLDITTTRSLRRLVDRVAARIDSDDPGWGHLSMHDLRRTWATQMRSQSVDAMVVLDWGGWNDLETFLQHYRGTSTPEAQRREREKVDWL
jgi:integrase